MKLLSNYFHLMPKSRFGKSIITLAGGTASAQIITACAMPIVTRLYLPSEIGIISLFLAFFAFWASLLSWRYESALLIAIDDGEAHNVFRVGEVCVLLMSGFSLPVLLLLIKTKTFGFGLLPTWSAFAGVPIFVGYGLFMLYRSWGLRGGFVSDISKASVARSASNAVVRVLLGIFGAGILGLFIAELVGAWAATRVMYQKIRFHYYKNNTLINLATMSAAAKRYSKFVKYEMPSILVDQLTLALPIPIIASLFGAAAAGWFGIARLLVALPNAQIGRAVADVFQMELAQCLREGELLKARQLFFKIMVKLTLFGIIPLVGMIVIGPWLVPVLLGKAWSEAGYITAYIAPWLYAALIVSTLSRLLSVLEQQEYKLVYDVLVLVSTALGYIAARKLMFSLDTLIILLSALNIFSYLVYLCLINLVVSKYLPK